MGFAAGAAGDAEGVVEHAAGDAAADGELALVPPVASPALDAFYLSGRGPRRVSASVVAEEAVAAVVGHVSWPVEREPGPDGVAAELPVVPEAAGHTQRSAAGHVGLAGV